MLNGSACAAAPCGLVYINTPGRTGFLSANWRQVIISRRLRWMVQWTCTQIAVTTVWLTSNSQLEGTIGRGADTAHTGSFITRRSHLSLLWIYIALSTPMIYTFCYGQSMENLKTTP